MQYRLTLGVAGFYFYRSGGSNPAEHNFYTDILTPKKQLHPLIRMESRF